MDDLSSFRDSFPKELYKLFLPRITTKGYLTTIYFTPCSLVINIKIYYLYKVRCNSITLELILTYSGSNHFGMAGYWALKAEKEGLIGMAFTNSSPIMVPTRSKHVKESLYHIYIKKMKDKLYFHITSILEI